MSELALTLLRLGFLLVLWAVVFLILNLMRRDLRQAERRSSRVQAVKADKPKRSRSNKLQQVTVIHADRNRETYPLVDGLTVGRAEDCTIKLVDDYASSQHAIVTRTEAGWTYTDKGSTNGSWLDKQRIESPVLLKPGTVVRIGKSTLRFEK